MLLVIEVRWCRLGLSSAVASKKATYLIGNEFNAADDSSDDALLDGSPSRRDNAATWPSDFHGI